MPARKRRATSPPTSHKRRRQSDFPARDVIELLDDDESMESILARIQEHESSEALAKQIDEQLNGGAGPSQPFGSCSNSVSSLGVQEREFIALKGEDDEALARRLAQEWENEDGVPMDVDDAPFVAKGNRKGVTQSVADSSAIFSDENAVHSSAEEDLLRHRNIFVHTRKCTKCGEDVVSPRGYVSYSPQIPPPSLLTLLHATCSSCQTNHCRGCFSVVNCPPSCRGNQKPGSSATTLCDVTTCCAKVRAIALFEALGGFDRLYIGEQTTSEKRAKEAAARHRSVMGSVGPGGTGYGTSGGSSGAYWSAVSFDLDDSEDDYSDTADEHAYVFGPQGRARGRSFGRGRGRGRGRAPVNANAYTSTQASMAAHWDEILVRALTTITSFLPAPYADDAQTYDMLPHSCIPSLIVMSKLPDLLGVLLRNDSVMEWTTRNDVYSATLGLLRRFADCEVTMQVLTDQRWEMKKTCGLEEWMWEDGEIIWEKTTDTHRPVVATPLYRYFKKLTKQCETFMAGAAQMLEGENAQDAGEETEKIVQATSLCGDILAARDDIERAMVVMGKDPEVVANGTPEPPVGVDAETEAEHEASSSTSKRGKGKRRRKDDKGKDRSADIEMERAYRQRCEQLAFQYVDIPNNTLAGHFHYANQVTSTANSTRNPKDRIHLIKELAVMATSLPPGIWVRIDETRNDIIKVMIAGPEGTPYSDGLFEFDCFIPLNYPNAPPLMNLCTTGGGHVRFNPNLYNNGKVCLSLLGTWAGSPEEMWRPRKSTLLQVFVSIQSMILIDLPYFNEPGYGKANPADVRSQSYNKNISLQTTRWAIVEWLKEEHKDRIWGDVIAAHFTIREEKIRKCIQAWALADSTFHTYTTSTRVSGYISPFNSIPPPHLPTSSFSAPSSFSATSSHNAGSFLPSPSSLPFSSFTSTPPTPSLPASTSTSTSTSTSYHAPTYAPSTAHLAPYSTIPKYAQSSTSAIPTSASGRMARTISAGPGAHDTRSAGKRLASRDTDKDRETRKTGVDLMCAFEEGMKRVWRWGKGKAAV